MPSTNPSRRIFMMHLALGGAAASLAAQAAPAAKAAAKPAAAPAGNMVAETDANAKALGYAADNTKVDAKKWPRHAKGQECLNCALYKGDAKMGDCPLFAGKKVAAKAWCNSWVKKA